MKIQALLVLLCASSALARFQSGHNFCDDEKDRFHSCKPLVNWQGCGCGHHSSSSSSSSSESGGSNEGSGSASGSWEVSGSGSGNSSEASGSGSWEISGSGSGSGVEGSGSGGEWQEGDLCFILQIFWKFSLTLDIELQFIFQEWINTTQITIVENIELTEYEIIVELYYSLQILFEKHVEIKVAIQYLYIGEWGYVCDLEGLVLDIQSATTTITIEQVITIVGGSCPLFDGLNECAQNATSSEQAAIEILIKELTIIIEGSFSFSYKLTLIFEKFQAFFVKYPDLKALIFSGRIEGFGILGSYVDLCAVYWRIFNFEFAIGGSVSDCKLIQALITWYSNASAGSVSQRSDVKQLSDKCSGYFETEVSVELRIEYFAIQLYQFFILEDWSIEVIYSIEIEGYGNLYQLIYAYIYCQNNGVGPGDFTSAPTTELTTEPTTTTSTSTSTSTSTTTTTTTTKPNGNCATVTSVNVVSVNITLLLTAIDNDQKTTHWNDSLIATFKGYKNRIWVISTNSSSSATDVNKFNAIKTVLTGFTTKADFKAIVYAIFIETWGTIGQYCGCSL